MKFYPSFFFFFMTWSWWKASLVPLPPFTSVTQAFLCGGKGSCFKCFEPRWEQCHRMSCSDRRCSDVKQHTHTCTRTQIYIALTRSFAFHRFYGLRWHRFPKNLTHVISHTLDILENFRGKNYVKKMYSQHSHPLNFFTFYQHRCQCIIHIFLSKEEWLG